MEARKRQHVVLFPYLAHGHINPFLALAELLARRHADLTVNVVNTHFNIQNINASFPPPSLSSSVRLRSLPFSPAAHGLPPDAHHFAAVPVQHIPAFTLACNSLQPAFEQLIEEITEEDGRPPLCIIADFFFPWTASVAHRLGVFHSIYITGGAYGMAVYFSLWTHLPHRQTAADEIPLTDFPGVLIHRSHLPKQLLDADGSEPRSVYIKDMLSRWSDADAMLINTVEEMETTGLQMLRKVVPVPIWPIGPLLISSPYTPNADKDGIFEWLDSKSPASVLYISFGSQNSITASQMMELAVGLEASGVQFVWAIRPPVEFDQKGDFKAEWLPEKFEERMREQGTGMVVHGWAPQLEILSHASTGAFLSHCGWNSVLESLRRGVPIIGWPLAAEQSPNAKMLEEELGVCVEVARGNMESSKAERKVVERVVREVMGGGERAKEIRRRVEEVRELMNAAWKEGVGSSFRGLEDFLRAAVSNSTRASKVEGRRTHGESESHGWTSV
ncbi:UDP-glycosyltransferase 92A1-like [Canna indica]|uniref:Glycosyltransferase n=1 Tax=Canna indica TaxID=4628 RepID=A0AAQ3QGA3_9LILI|nr:UDP-glycosyltransferase 92A1-like [Canna indica]